MTLCKKSAFFSPETICAPHVPIKGSRRSWGEEGHEFMTCVRCGIESCGTLLSVIEIDIYGNTMSKVRQDNETGGVPRSDEGDMGRRMRGEVEEACMDGLEVG